MKTLTSMLLITPLSLFLIGSPGPASPAPDEVTFYQHVAWSPNGHQLATSAMKISRPLWEKEKFRAMSKSQFDVYVVSLDGSRAARLTENPENDMWAIWWPGGRCLFFSTERGGASSLYWIKADGTDPQRLPYDWPGRVSEPSVSADGKKIAFTVRDEKGSHIYVLANQGGDRAPVKLTAAGNNWGPVWSPDGTEIAFYSDRMGKGRDQIFLIKPDGSGEMQLTNDTFNNTFPSWSPDGKRIIFASNREAQGSIYVMDADGSNPGRLNLGMPAFMARWSPDGKKLAFISGNFPDTQIFVSNADGANPVALTK